MNKSTIIIVLAVAGMTAAFLYFKTSSSSRVNVEYGSISGRTGYPSSAIPKQKICAENINKIGDVYCIETEEGQLEYQMKLPVGEYYVYSGLLQQPGDISLNYKAYYNEFVLCGLQEKCDNKTYHKAFARIVVRANEILPNINPVDWYDRSQK